MKRIVVFAIFVLIFSQVGETKAEKVVEFGLNSAAQMTKVITDVNVVENFIRFDKRKTANQKILTSGALIIKVTKNGAQMATLGDLVKGKKALIWVTKKRGFNKPFQGLVIMQFFGTKAVVGMPPTVQFAAGFSQGLENTTPEIMVVLSKVLKKDVKISYTISGTATGGGTDYALVNGDLVIPAGQTIGIIPLLVANDFGQEEDETVVVTLTSTTEATLGTQKIHTYTIQDDDHQSGVGFDATASSGAESATSVNIPVSLLATSIGETRVNYTVAGTATGGGTDYTLSNGTLTIPAGQTTAHITLAVVNDTMDEVDETVIITLSSPVNAILGLTSVHTYTIKDNDNPTIQFSSASANGLENVTPVLVGVTLSAAAAVEVQVGYAVSGSATGGGKDYTLASGTFTIAAGQLSTNLSLAIVEDTFQDPHETVIITLVDPMNASLGLMKEYTYTINDND